VSVSSSGGVFYWSKRIGVGSKIFYMPKFRTMYSKTPDIATHLLKDSEKYITPVGKWLRRYSLDELPQFFSVIKGEMSLVGPRPALYNQFDLIKGRKKLGIDRILPGITGWAQINGRDEVSIDNKIILDLEYMNNQSISLDLKILILTIVKSISKENVSH